MYAIIAGLVAVPILAEVSQQAFNSLDCLFVAFDLSLAMKLLLTPVGPNDKVIDWIPRIAGFIPHKQHVCVLVCNDGKDYSPTIRTAFDRSYYERLFKKMCKLNNNVVQTVSLEVISFFEPDTDFYEKLHNCDFFFMAGFTSHVEHVEAIFRRDDESMTLKRMAVANRVVTNEMAMWAVCGSAVSCGTSWDMQVSCRVLPNSLYQMLELLADGHICYAACSGPQGITVTDNLKEWHISSGTGLIIVTNDRLQHGESFVCVKKHYAEYQAQCVLITHKMVRQLEQLNSMVSHYRSEQAHNSQCWRLFWGTGKSQWV